MKFPSLPLLEIYADEKREDYGDYFFSNCLAVMVPHLTSDLPTFLRAFKTLGLKPENCHLIIKPYPYIQKVVLSSGPKSKDIN